MRKIIYRSACAPSQRMPVGLLWYLTPFGWIQAYLTLLIFIHELGHFIVALATGHTITLFKVGMRDPSFAFTVRRIRFEFSGDAFGGTVSVMRSNQRPQLCILATALAAPLFEILFGTALLGIMAVTAAIPHMALREITGTVLLICALMAYCIAIENVVKELRNIIRKK